MFGFAWRTVLVGVAYLIAMSVAGAVAPLVGISAPPLPEGADAERLGQWFVLTSLLVGFAVALLSTALGGTRWQRWLTVAGVVYAAQGINTLLEASIFSTGAVAAGGGARLFYLFAYLWPALASSGMAALLWRPRTGPVCFAASAPLRPALAVVAFMAIYLGVGALISPLVIDAYRTGLGELTLPPFGTIVATQAARGAVFVAVCLPLLSAWRARSASLVYRLGISLWILLGPAFLLPAEWLPLRLRLIHGAELLVDSVLFALSLAVLFRAPARPAPAEGLRPS